MSIQEILEEIPRLSSAERQVLINRMMALEEDPAAPWTPQKLADAAGKLAAEDDSTKAHALREEMVDGFYGKGSGA